MKHICGFSLIELLIVIALIGILTAIAAVSYSTVQKKSRDSRRVSDMKAIQNGYEQYYGDYNVYLDTCTNPGDNYFPSWPLVDPKNSGSYVYTSGTCNSTKYCWCAKLEAGTGNYGSSTCGAGTGFYCVKQLQ